jgi:sulfonate transport system substrate-binding protein
VKLRIGDQFDYLQTLLKLSGQDQDLPYEVEYATFVGGPPMLQAFQAGQLDAGFIGTTPLIFAQAAGLDLVGIAGWATSQRSAYGLITAPGVTGITGWGDLKGKTVAFQRGTAGEAVLLQALDAVGLKESDIKVVDVTQVSVTATLEGGSADVGIQVEPLTSAYLAAHPDASEVVAATELTDRSSILISTTDALDDAGKSAALGDYITRLVKAFAYLKDHQDELANGVYVQIYGLTPERAAEVVAANGVTNFFELPGDLLEPQQKLADLFVAAEQIPDSVDVSAEFDPRFNDLVTATQGS